MDEDTTHPVSHPVIASLREEIQRAKDELNYWQMRLADLEQELLCFENIENCPPDEGD